MGSHAPVARKPSQDEPPEERLLGRSDLLTASAKSQLLGRIAEALQVPQAELYGLPDAVTSAQVVDSANAPDHDLEQACEALLHAYRRIRNPEMRHRLLRLVKDAARQV